MCVNILEMHTFSVSSYSAFEHDGIVQLSLIFGRIYMLKSAFLLSQR